MTDQDSESGDKSALYLRVLELDLEGRSSWPVWVRTNPSAKGSAFDDGLSVSDQNNWPGEKAGLYLRAIELLEVRLAAGGLEGKRLNELRRLIPKLKRALAKLFVGKMTGMEFIYPLRIVEVGPYWVVDGQPRQRAKVQAHEWMAARGQPWNGSAKTLRDAVRRALHRNDAVPDGYFGLHVERTVKIQTRRELNLHLLPEQS
jgi:hypothetical protein